MSKVWDVPGRHEGLAVRGEYNQSANIPAEKLSKSYYGYTPQAPLA